MVYESPSKTLNPAKSEITPLILKLIKSIPELTDGVDRISNCRLATNPSCETTVEVE